MDKERERRKWMLAVAICLAAILYLVLSPGPDFYSFDEQANAQAKCKDTNDDSCLVRELKAWRVENPNGAWGNR
jgi:hypothetical protein